MRAEKRVLAAYRSPRIVRLGSPKMDDLEFAQGKLEDRKGVQTYATIPAIAINTPITDLSPTARPEVIHPRATIEHVFTWPTTVLETGPV